MTNGFSPADSKVNHGSRITAASSGNPYPSNPPFCVISHGYDMDTTTSGISFVKMSYPCYNHVISLFQKRLDDISDCDWVGCLLGRIRGHGRRDIVPRNRQQHLRCRQWRCPIVPAAWPPGSSWRNKGICSFFCSLCSPCSGRRRNSILSYAPDHLAFSPQRFLTATTLPPRST